MGPDLLEKKASFVLALIRILDCPARSPVDLTSNYPGPTTVYNIQQFHVLPTHCVFMCFVWI